MMITWSIVRRCSLQLKSVGPVCACVCLRTSGNSALVGAVRSPDPLLSLCKQPPLLAQHACLFFLHDIAHAAPDCLAHQHFCLAICHDKASRMAARSGALKIPLQLFPARAARACSGEAGLWYALFVVDVGLGACFSTGK